MSSRDEALVIGGGISGMRASLDLADLGVKVRLVEKRPSLGGTLGDVNRIFPSMLPSNEVLAPVIGAVMESDRIEVMLETEVTDVRRDGGIFVGTLSPGKKIEAGCVVLAAGLQPFDATAIPEFGLGRRGVMTSLELEGLLRDRGDGSFKLEGSEIKSVAFIQCVGSRVESRGYPYCSAVCCAGAIKNALLIKGIDPGIEVSILYIDIRTHGKGWEDLYREGRKRGIMFIRGQPSMVYQRPGVDGLMVSGENTLLKELYQIRADLVVLQVGLGTSESARRMLSSLGVEIGGDGLPAGDLPDGVFLAGTVDSPKDMASCIDQAGACAARAAIYLNDR